MIDIEKFQQEVAIKAKGALIFNKNVDHALKIVFAREGIMSEIEKVIKEQSEEFAIEKFTHSFIRTLVECTR